MLPLVLLLALPVAHAVDAPAMKYEPVSNDPQAGGQDRFIITYRSDVAARTTAAVVQEVGVAMARAGIATNLGGQPVRHLRRLSTGAELVRTGRKLDPREANALMQRLAGDPAVLYVEPDTLVRANDIRPDQPIVPNDPRFGEQWHLRPGNGAMENIGKDTTAYANRGGSNASMAWHLSEGEGAIVAVLDTGITQHPDLDLSLANAGYDFIIDKQISGRAADGRVPGGWDTGDWIVAWQCFPFPPENSSWHGTHVAGTIAERTGNGIGMAGVAPKAKVLPLRVLGHCGGYRSDIADAITWASGGSVSGLPANQHKAQVINMSFGENSLCAADGVFAQAINGAVSRGTTVVVAAGNDNADMANYSPSSCPGVIAVAANGITGRRAHYSNWGSGVTLAAPGGGRYANDASSGSLQDAGFIWSTINQGTTVPTEAGYAGYPGTSMAAPHVAGVVALMVSARQALDLAPLTPAEIRSILRGSSRAFPLMPDKAIGVGIVDAYAAVVGATDTGGDLAAPLPNGALRSNWAGAAGEGLLFAIDVPAGAQNLNLRTFGGTGDVSLFVKRAGAPGSDGSGADFRSVKPGNSESVVIAAPAAGTWYLRVLGVKDFANVSVIASFKAP
ncbi:MAG TPA: S8 family peptidase [Acetobacteraceae bacterium]